MPPNRHPTSPVQCRISIIDAPLHYTNVGLMLLLTGMLPGGKTGLGHQAQETGFLPVFFCQLDVSELHTNNSLYVSIQSDVL